MRLDVDTLPLPPGKDEGWRGSALRTLEGLRLRAEVGTHELVRLASVLDAVRKHRPLAALVCASGDRWLRQDGRGGDASIRMQDDTLGLATAPRWVGWSEGFLWGTRVQEALSVKRLVVKADASLKTLVVVAAGGGPSALGIDVAAGASLDVVELREHSTADVLAASRVRMTLGEGATVRWFRAIAGEGARADDLEASAQEGARLELANVATAGKVTRTDARVFLQGKGASFALDGLAIGEGTNVGDFRIGIEHAAPETKSQQEYRTIGNGQSASLFHGRVVIPPQCPGVEAHQQAPSLLLSRGARVQSRPQLEIHTDEVQCSHGSTVGELDPTALFYLRSRGLDAETARHLLVEGFARSVLERWEAVLGREGLATLDGLWKGGVA